MVSEEGDSREEVCITCGTRKLVSDEDVHYLDYGDNSTGAYICPNVSSVYFKYVQFIVC